MNCRHKTTLMAGDFDDDFQHFDMSSTHDAFTALFDTDLEDDFPWGGVRRLMKKG